VNKEGKFSSIVRTMESHFMLSMYRFCHQGHAVFEAEVCRFCVRKLLKEQFVKIAKSLTGHSILFSKSYLFQDIRYVIHFKCHPFQADVVNCKVTSASGSL